MFGFFRRNVYLDHNATTPISGAVRSAMARAMKHYWGNPSSGYRVGKTAVQAMELAREQVATAIHAHAHEVYFTSCATEANNAILKTLAAKFAGSRKKIISSPIEHPSVKNTLEFLQSQGTAVEYFTVDKYGFADLKELETMISKGDVFLVCCMYANNETGSIQNVKQIASLAKQHGALTLSDGVQAFGKIPVNVKELDVDYATFSAHKLYGPKGIGVLYARISSPLEPFVHGGHQEEGMRAGTESVHNIVGFGRACKDVDKLLSKTEDMKRLKDKLVNGLMKLKPDIVVNSPSVNCLPNTISVTFTGIRSKELMMMLDYHGIAVSAGSACSSELSTPSHVLKAIGLSDKAADETLRISLGTDTSDADIRYTLKVIANYLKENS